MFLIENTLKNVKKNVFFIVVKMRKTDTSITNIPATFVLY